MLFNIAYFGPTNYHNLRRDFILALQKGLESLGHRTYLSGTTLHDNCVNLIVGAYFLSSAQMNQVAGIGLRYINVNTEVIKNNALNFKADKVDLNGAYMPLIRKGVAAWDVIQDNMPEYKSRGVRKSHFLRWGWLPEMEEIRHDRGKDLDFYFFGSMSDRRKMIMEHLASNRLEGLWDDDCPYFVRNDRISRAKVQINVVQADLFTHVNSFRICYLANNRCAILSEKEEDPAGYLEMARVADIRDFAAQIRELASGDNYLKAGEAAYETFKRTPMKDCLAPLLDATFGAGTD